MINGSEGDVMVVNLWLLIIRLCLNFLIMRFDVSYIVLFLSVLVILNCWCRDKKRKKEKEKVERIWKIKGF